MARRAEGLGGTLAVTSSDGAGARLVLTVPL
jgi:signal transduction histidine kinase